jgi:hypothetical protein
MIRPTLSSSPAASAARPTPRPPSVALTEAERSSIATAFPEQPAVAQRLYGATREVTTAAPLGGRLDLSA